MPRLPTASGAGETATATERRRLEAPLKTRGLAHGGPESYMDGGTLAQWFDVIVHRQEVTPVLPA